MLKRIWLAIRGPDAGRGTILLRFLGAGLVFAVAAGALVTAGAAGLAWTNTEKFCIGCHEMRDNVYAEYKDTIHDKNRTGVRASCPDCHVTRVWTRMKETDSLECRNCHHDDAWDQEKQSDRAKARHAKGKAEGLTCIDCHFGIAHKEPEGPGPREMKLAN